MDEARRLQKEQRELELELEDELLKAKVIWVQGTWVPVGGIQY